MSREPIALIMESISEAVIAYDMQQHLIYANTACVALLGVNLAELQHHAISDFIHPTDWVAHQPMFDGLWHGVGFENVEFRILTHAQQERWCLSSWRPLYDTDHRQIGICGTLRDITNRKQTELALRSTEVRQRFMMQANALLASTADYRTQLREIAKLAVPTIADWCIIDMYDTDDQMRRFVIEYDNSEPIPEGITRALVTPVDLTRDQLHSTTLRNGQTFFMPRISKEALAQFAHNEQHLAAMREIGFHALIAVPMHTHGVTFGVIMFLLSHSERSFTESDRILAEELAERTSLVVDNQLLHQKAQMQRDWFQGVLSSIGDAVVAMNTHGQVTFTNPVAERLINKSHGTGSTQFEDLFYIVDETTGDRLENISAIVLRENRILNLNHALLVPQNDEPLPIDISAAPIHSSNGEDIGVVLVFRDISTRRFAELQLARLNAQIQSQRQRLDTIISTVPGVVWEALTTDEPNVLQVYFVSNYAETLLGYPIEEWFNTPHFWLKIMHPDDRRRVVIELTNMVKSRKGGTIEFRWLTKDQQMFWIEAQSVVIFDENGELIGMRGISMNITARKRAEENQQFLSEISNILALSLDYEVTLKQITSLMVPKLADWSVIHILRDENTIQRLGFIHRDPSRATLLESTPEIQPINLQPRYMVLAVLRSGQTECYNDVSDEMLREATCDELLFRIAKQLGFSSYICVPLRVRDHVLGALTLAIADSGRRYDSVDVELVEEIARRAALAIENARLYEEAQEAIQTRDVFLSVASHELKTPLTSLLGNAQLMMRRAQREQNLNQRDMRSLQIINNQALRLNRMISALLDLSRLQMGQLSIDLKEFNLDELCQRTIQEVQSALDMHTIQYMPPEHPILIVGDELRLEQVIQNLIQNAVKYSPLGGTITIALQQSLHEARLSVSDRGIGIPKASLPHIFSRFYRASNADPLHISGMGVGLYVVKEIVGLHKGRITVESQEGEGTTFTIFLPLADNA